MNKTLKLLATISLMILAQSCNQNNIIEINNFDDSQKAISYGKNEIVDSIIVKKGNIKISKFISKKHKKNNKFFKVYFYDNAGNISSEGDMYQNNKIGNWLYFDNKQMFKKEEYVLFCKKIFINQKWEYDSENKINYSKSNFYSYRFVDTIIDKEKVKLLKFKFYPSHEIKIDKISFFASSKIQKNFCNIHSLQLIDILKNQKK